MSAFNIFEEIRAISWSDLPTWASAQDEGVHLDFKRKCEPHKADLDPEDKEVLSKALSGFANTEGGVLLVGVETESDKGIDRFTRLGPVCPLDQVTQRIAAQFANLTDPPIPALQVHQICDPENPTQGVVAIYVPASDGGPHRAMCGNRTKDRYFMRSTDATSPMPHSLLADRFGRAAKPRLSLRVWWQGGTATGQMLRIRLTNEGRGTARQPAIQVIVEGTLMQAMNFEIARMYTPQSEWKKRESRVAGKHAIHDE